MKTQIFSLTELSNFFNNTLNFKLTDNAMLSSLPKAAPIISTPNIQKQKALALMS